MGGPKVLSNKKEKKKKSTSKSNPKAQSHLVRVGLYPHSKPPAVPRPLSWLVRWCSVCMASPAAHLVHIVKFP